MPQPLLSLQGVAKSFGAAPALRNIDLEIAHGEFIALLGPSGCGKTTLLRSIGGFVTPDSGRILIDGVDMMGSPPHLRPLNTVFQHYALFPHMTVAQNAAYGPLRTGVSKQEAATRAIEALGMVDMARFSERFPRELSGGQQQRVALARAVVNRPKLLLLDEPLSALDMKLRKRMQLELKQLQSSLGITFLFVTHDQEEAMALADRIVLMNDGRIEQVGTGPQPYMQPRTRFAAEFIGEANFFDFRRSEHAIELNSGLATVRSNAPDVPDRGLAVLRPEFLRVADASELSQQDCRFSATPLETLRLGSHDILYVQAQGQTMSVRLPGNRLPARLPSRVELVFDPANLHLLPQES
jgi:spermidine/putrescine transport system ATP-binding protein